jgi:hypothetical protein
MSELEYTPEELKEISVYFQRLESLKAEPEPTELDLFLKENPFVCSKCNTARSRMFSWDGPARIATGSRPT